MRSTEFTQLVLRYAKANDQRTGQALSNLVYSRTTFNTCDILDDPFHKDLSEREVFEWIERHLIFNDSGWIIGIFNKNIILWERNNG